MVARLCRLLPARTCSLASQQIFYFDNVVHNLTFKCYTFDGAKIRQFSEKSNNSQSYFEI